MDLGKFEKSQFDAAAPAYRRKLWVQLVSPGGATHLVFFWRRIAAVLLLLLLLGWLAAAGAAYAFVRVRHDFAGLSYLNLVWPPRWPQHREALGRNYLARGQSALAAGEFADAAQFFAAGLARVPADIAARRQLAIIYLRFGQLQAGLDILSAGLAQARDDLDYLKLTFGLLDELKEDTRILELARLHLPSQPDEVLVHQFVALQAAGARYQHGDYTGAEQLIADWRLDRSLEGQLLLARCDWERGYPELALLRLQQQRERFPQRDELPLQLIRFYRELGRTEQELNEALIRHAADPFSPGPRIDLLYARQRNQDQVRLNQEREAYLKDFATDPSALLLLAWFASDTGDAALARRLRDAAVAGGQPVTNFEFALVQCLALNRDYPAAQAAIDLALQGPAAADPRFAGTLAGLRALVCFGAGDTENGELHLKAFLLRQRPRANDSLLLARRLLELGATTAATRILETAVRQDPLNQAVLTELVRQQAQAGDRSALLTSVPRLLAMRKPARAVLQEATLRLDPTQPADLELRTAIQAALEKSSALPEPPS